MTAPKEQQKRLNLETLILQHGAHPHPEKGLCVMEAVAFAAGEPHSDHPDCACPVIGALMRSLNDRLDPQHRQELKRYVFVLIGTKSTAAVEHKRRYMAADWAIRTALPFCLREAKLDDHAKALEALPEIVNQESRDKAWPLIRAADDAARAARRESWERWDAAWLTKKNAEVAAAEVAAAAVAAAVAAVEAAAAAAAAAAVAAEAEVAAAEAVAAAVVAVAVVAVAAQKKADAIRAGLTASAHGLVERMLAVKV
jgi:hypothetical protein